MNKYFIFRLRCAHTHALCYLFIHSYVFLFCFVFFLFIFCIGFSTYRLSSVIFRHNIICFQCSTHKHTHFKWTKHTQKKHLMCLSLWVCVCSRLFGASQQTFRKYYPQTQYYYFINGQKSADDWTNWFEKQNKKKDQHTFAYYGIEVW